MKYLRARFNLIIAVFLVCCFGIVELATADNCGGLKVDGSARWRYEADGRDFNGDTDMGKNSVLRTRLGFKLSAGDVTSYMQVQYPYVMGWDASNLGTSGDLDVHQLFLNIDKFLMSSLSMKIGRQEMNYGDQRLIGGVGWSNIGRTFDGVVFTFETDAIALDAFMTKQVERYPNNTDNPGAAPDDHFSGLWVVYKPLKLNVFALFNAEADMNMYNNFETGYTLNTFGLHYKNHYDSGLGVLLDYAMQMGAMGDDVDLSGMLIVAALSYTIDNPMKPKIAAGIDMASGDDPETDKEIERFNDLYYTGHKWRGHMDFFVDGMDEGITDIFFKLSAMPMPGTYLALTFHNFATGQDYDSVVDGEEVTALGNELDIDLKMHLKKNLALMAGMGMFMPAEEWKGSDADNAMWYYLGLSTYFCSGGDACCPKK